MLGGTAETSRSDTERIVTNPLTNERFVIREFINGLSDSDRLEVFRSLRDGDSPAELSTIACWTDVSRRTVSSHVSDGLS